jgi:hypothetical protein
VDARHKAGHDGAYDPAPASGKNMSFQSAGGFFSVPTLAMKETNGPIPPSLVF